MDVNNTLFEFELGRLPMNEYATRVRAIPYPKTLD